MNPRVLWLALPVLALGFAAGLMSSKMRDRTPSPAEGPMAKSRLETATLDGALNPAPPAAWDLSAESASAMSPQRPAQAAHSDAPSPFDAWVALLAEAAPLDATEAQLAKLRGRTVLVNFWATWCGPCVTEIPVLDALHAAHADAGFSVLGVALDTPEAVRAFVAETPFTYPTLVGEAALDVMTRLGNQTGALPFSVLLGPDGQILDTHLGVLDPVSAATFARRE